MFCRLILAPYLRINCFFQKIIVLPPYALNTARGDFFVYKLSSQFRKPKLFNFSFVLSIQTFFSHKFLMNINQDFILDPLNCLRIFCKNSYTSFRRVESINYKRIKLFATFSFCTNYEQNLRELNFFLLYPFFNQGQIPRSNLGI